MRLGFISTMGKKMSAFLYFPQWFDHLCFDGLCSLGSTGTDDSKCPSPFLGEQPQSFPCWRAPFGNWMELQSYKPVLGCYVVMGGSGPRRGGEWGGS